MGKKKLTIDDIEFVDAVFSIPKNSVMVKIDITTYERGEAHRVSAKFEPAEVREAIDLFEQTVSGDYPKYVLTEKGKEYAEQLLAERK